jgi:hypothetical protein
VLTGPDHPAGAFSTDETLYAIETIRVNAQMFIFLKSMKLQNASG